MENFRGSAALLNEVASIIGAKGGRSGDSSSSHLLAPRGCGPGKKEYHIVMV